MAKQSHLHCSFCARSRDEVKILIAGQEGHICENCVEHAQEIIAQELNIKPENGNSTGSNNFKLSVRKPAEIKKFLDNPSTPTEPKTIFIPTPKAVFINNFYPKYEGVKFKKEEENPWLKK